MNDRNLDNQINPEQLRQMQNIAALLGQGIGNNALGLLGGNLNLLNPIALQNLLTSSMRANSMANNSTQPNLNDSTSALDQQQYQQQQQQQQQQISHNELTQRIQQQLSQIVQQSQRQRQPQSNINNEPVSLAMRQQSETLHNTLQQGDQRRKRPRQQQQLHTSFGSLASEPTSLVVRPQATLQNALQGAVGLPGLDQKRKRGRPPLSAPSTSAGSSTMDLNYLNMFAAVKTQQDRERMQREAKLAQERQLEMRKQQEREKQKELRLAAEKAERQRELRAQQERERLRIEHERQRKAQHRLALQEIDRERRRQHMNMVRNLDAYKRNEEREKTMTAMMAERHKQNERRMYQKRLEAELIKDIRKPVDDMMLKNHKPLATLNRIPGLKLPGKAFADLLMAYEFLCNFGETVGLEPKEIPDINALQQGMLNHDDRSEEQLINVMHHLCMFAVKDPRFPYTGSTKEIESLECNNEGLSQLLHFYLQVLTLNAKTKMEHEDRLYKLIEQRYFLSFNATQKAEMLAFICNELLCSQTVAKQMEDAIESVAKLRKDKWVLENELRKYRHIKTKREAKEEAAERAKETAVAATNGETENDDGKNEDSKTNVKSEKDEKSSRASLTNGSSLIDTSGKKDNLADISPQQNNTIDLDDLEPTMTNEDLNKKIENLTRQYNKTSNKLDRASNSMRASPLGQDRYRRRYWVLPQVGGVFVEGMESSEPEEMENNKFTEEELLEFEQEQQALLELTESSAPEEGAEEKIDVKLEKDDEDIEMKDENLDGKEEDEAMDVKEEDVAPNGEIKEEVKVESIENGAPDGVDKSNGIEVSTEDINAQPMPTAPWFSILPRQVCDFYKKPAEVQEPVASEETIKKAEEDATEPKAELTSEELRAMRFEICPALAKKLEELEAEQYETPKKIHPQFQCGWWRITDAQQLKAILAVLHERGSRERILSKHLTKHFQYASNSCKNSTVDFEITAYDRQLAGKNYGAPIPHKDDDSADDLNQGEEEEEEEEDGEELDEETGDDKTVQQAAAAPAKKSKRKKASRSARSRRLRARAAARKKVENSKNKVAAR